MGCRSRHVLGCRDDRHHIEGHLARGNDVDGGKDSRGARHVGLHPAHVLRGFDRDSARVERDSLADQGKHLGAGLGRNAVLPVAAMAQADQTRWQRRARGNSQQKVVTAGPQLGRPENLDLHVVALGDLRRLLRQGLRRELVRGRVLPFASAVGRLPVLLRGDDLVLAPDPEAGQDELFDLPPLRLRAGLPRAPFEGAHDAAFDDGLQRVHAQWRLRAHQADPLVSVRARSADELVVGRPQPLAVKVLGGPDSIEDHAPGRRPAVRRHGKNLVDAAAKLCAGDHVGQHSAERFVQVESAARQALTGGDRNRQRVDRELRGRRRDQADLHGRLSVTIGPGAPRPAPGHEPPSA